MQPLHVPTFREFAAKNGVRGLRSEDEEIPYLTRMQRAYSQLQEWHRASSRRLKTVEELFNEQAAPPPLEGQPIPFGRMLTRMKEEMTLDANFAALAFEEFEMLEKRQKVPQKCKRLL